jgi:hypothetical protein
MVRSQDSDAPGNSNLAARRRPAFASSPLPQCRR